MAQSGVWSQGDSSRIVVPAVFPGEEEEGVGRKGSGGIYFPSPLREAVEDGNPCPARVGDKKKAWNGKDVAVLRGGMAIQGKCWLMVNGGGSGAPVWNSSLSPGAEEGAGNAGGLLLHVGLFSSSGRSL